VTRPLLREKMPTATARRKSAPRAKSTRAVGQWKLRPVRGLRFFEAPALAKLDWLVHGFSTRVGGASQLNDSHVLNLGFTDWDSHDHVAENRHTFLRAIGAENMRLVTLRQIHSDIPHRVDATSSASTDPPRGDALYTREPAILLAVQTADCVPILLADTKNRAVAAIHSGWRGTQRRISAKTLGRMQMEFGTRPEDVVAALGPGIGRCCYEVGSEVARDFESQFPQARDWFDGPFDALASGENDPNWLPWLTMRPPGHPPPSPKVNLDLIAANRAILVNAGVPARQISASDLCTSCRTDLFFSYRREHATGRMIAAIGIR
jgi:polyphenol oxidase